MADKPFVHLHTHSHYSLLSALPKIDELLDTAKENNMPALALTDNGNLYATIEFYKAAQKAGIKPIIGVDAYLALRTRHDKDARIDNKRHRLVLLAKNIEGYKNLLKMVTEANLSGFYYKPRIDDELLRLYAKGLIALAPSHTSDIAAAINANDTAKATERIAFYKELFGPDNFYMEITRHPEIAGHISFGNKIVQLAKETSTPLVACHNIFYLKPEDKQARDTLVMVNNTGDRSEAATGDDDDFSFLSTEAMYERFADLPEALANTVKIADQCQLTLELGKWTFPNYIVPSGLSYDDELRRLVIEGIPKHGLTPTPEIMERAEYELSVIQKKGYAPYFLVVSDLLRYAHSAGILTTIRGSVAGSLVTYLAGITNVNPLEYNLPFERFLNPERPSAPDIDMDYADNRRDDMIAYARATYGADKVAQIGTFGTMMARGSVRDVARAMGYPYEIGDRISKLIPMGAQGFPMTIDRALTEVPELRELYEKDEDSRRIVDMAKKIEGCARHISVHAAGVVIAPRPLTDFVPLQRDTKGEDKIITQYDMHAVEDAGLLKFDFLGIKNLAILADAVERVQKIEHMTVDIENIPLDDPKTFGILSRGETIGLFQLNGTGMTRFLMDLRPSTIHDINAMVALYRPGPIEMIPEYIRRKHDPSLITYLDPRMKDIVHRSYGVITYQDDVMMVAIKLGGYSWLEADKLRKAMGKKIPKEMEEQKGKLLEGFIKNGMSAKKAKELWALIEPFASYGFNKAHAASYGRVAYQTAYMKANFPAIYMSAVLTADAGDVEKIGEIVAECKRMNIPVLPPDINESFSQFTVVKAGGPGNTEADRIRFGLVTIKNFGQGVATAIIEERKRGGPFTSLINFLDRVHERTMNKKSMEALIKAGALDRFGISRGTLLANLETMVAYNRAHTQQPQGQDSLFGLMTDTSSLPTLALVPAADIDSRTQLSWEKELLGLYVTGHPLDKYRPLIEKRDFNISKAKELAAEKEVLLAAIIEEVKPITTKKGDAMLFIRLADFSDTIEAVIFPRVLIEFKSLLTVDRCVVVKAKVSERNGTKSLIVEKMKELS